MHVQSKGIVVAVSLSLDAKLNAKFTLFSFGRVFMCIDKADEGHEDGKSDQAKDCQGMDGG